MIARTWRGWTKAEDADAYFNYLRETGISGYSKTDGNLGQMTLRRIAHDRAEFFMVSLWSSMKAVERFAGPSPDKAVFFPQDDFFLIARDRHVDHFELLHSDLRAIRAANDPR